MFVKKIVLLFFFIAAIAAKAQDTCIKKCIEVAIDDPETLFAIDKFINQSDSLKMFYIVHFIWSEDSIIIEMQAVDKTILQDDITLIAIICADRFFYRSGKLCFVVQEFYPANRSSSRKFGKKIKKYMHPTGRRECLSSIMGRF